MKVFAVVEIDSNKEIDIVVSGTEFYNGDVTQAAIFFSQEDAKNALKWWAGELAPEGDGNRYAIAEYELEDGTVVFINPEETEEK